MTAIAVTDWRIDELRGAVACKWAGALAMLTEHVSTHALERWAASLPQLVGAFAFPLFVASFAALAGGDSERWERTAHRLGFLAMLAQATGYLVGREGQLNVLATFAFGALLAAGVKDRRWWLAAVACGLGAWCEFNIAGVGAIAAALLIVNDPRGGSLRWLALLVSAAMLPAWNAGVPPVVVWMACAFAPVLLVLPIDMPDRRGAFAIGYVAQWPLLRLIRDARDIFG